MISYIYNLLNKLQPQVSNWRSTDSYREEKLLQDKHERFARLRNLHAANQSNG